jgi:hypothetical protein
MAGRVFGMIRRGFSLDYLALTVKRLNEPSLEDCLGRQRTIAIYIVDGGGAGIVLVSTLTGSGLLRALHFGSRELFGTYKIPEQILIELQIFAILHQPISYPSIAGWPA